VKPFSEEEQAKRRRPWPEREGFRRIAVLIAPTGLYAVLVLISLLGGPRIGAPLIPLPGGGTEVTSPEAGQQPGQLPSRIFPPIPWHTPASVPVPPTSAVTPSTVDPSTGRPVDGPTTTPATQPTVPGKPSPTTAERSLPPLPPATKTPPRPTTDPTTAPTTDPTTDPPVTPTNQPTTPNDPDQPKPPAPTLVGTLLGLLGRLGL
jgi:hypothetical protein